MKKTINILLFAVLLAGCTDLDIAPNSQLTDQSAFKKKSEFVNGLAGVYTSLWCWDEVVYKMGGSTDEMVFPARGADWKGDLQPLYLHTFTSSNGEISGIYSELSNIIAVSNTYIDMKQIPDSSIAFSPVLVAPPSVNPKIAITESDLSDYPGMHLMKFNKKLKTGETYSFSIAGTSISSAHHDDPLNEAERLTIYAKLEGRDRLVKFHEQA